MGKRILLKNVSQILTMTEPWLLENQSILIENGKIVEITNKDVKETEIVIDGRGKLVTPGFIDPHTHLVFAGSRTREFEARLKGKTYQQITQDGGGILSTVEATRKASQTQLINLSLERLYRMLEWGTTTVEIKSGYGLNFEEEIKLLEVIQQLKERVPQTIVSTFLGAHTFPKEYKRDEYIFLLENKLIPETAKRKLASFIDVFCDPLGFSNEEARKILEKASQYGFKLKLHVDETGDSKGALLAAETKAISAEHLIHSSKDGLLKLKENDVVAVLLPTTSLFLGEEKKPDIGYMKEIGLTMAIGSDFNPGTSPYYAMPLVMNIGCIWYNLSLKEVWEGVTINAAKALGLQNSKGSLEEEKDADILIFNTEDYRDIPYMPNRNFLSIILIKGSIVYERRH